MNHPKLFIWREVPIDVDTEMYEALINNWDNDVYVYSFEKMPQERVKAGVKTIDSTVYIVETLIPQIKQLISANKGAIHIFPNIKGRTWDEFGLYCISEGVPNIVTLGERANRRYSMFLDFISLVVNKYRFVKYGKYVKARIQMGESGVQSSKIIGWPQEKLYPFMYCPNEQVATEFCSSIGEGKTRFLYLGRFAKKYKGIDVLMKAVDLLPETDKWSIDFVSGYGDYKKELEDWARKKTNVRILGTWDSSSIVRKMSEYDVVVIPSTYDGWNLNANYAIRANVPVIITNRAGSDDLIMNGDNGFVVESDNPVAIQNAMYSFIGTDNPVLRKDEVNDKLRMVTTPQYVAEYLRHILEYSCLGGEQERPVCPWRL